MTAHHSINQRFFWLKLTAFSVFVGRGLQHFIADTPYRSFFWDESLFGLEGNDWSYFSNVLFSEQNIEYLAFAIGIYFIICAVVVLTLSKYKYREEIANATFAKKILGFGTLLLLVLSLLYAKNHFFELPQFLEYTAQYCSPLFLIYFISKGWDAKLELFLKISLSLTFACHGIYALGILPTPVHFMEMTMEIMNVDENAARLFLTWAGIMDFVVAVMVFMPGKIMKSALIYMIVWGAMTAFARTLYPLLGTHFAIIPITIGILETIVRFPHFIIGFVLFQFKTIQK